MNDYCIKVEEALMSELGLEKLNHSMQDLVHEHAGECCVNGITPYGCAMEIKEEILLSAQKVMCESNVYSVKCKGVTVHINQDQVTQEFSIKLENIKIDNPTDILVFIEKALNQPPKKVS